MKAIRHAGIVVSDLEKSLHFYRDIFGFKAIKRSDEPGGYIDRICGLRSSKLTTVKLTADDGNLIELLFFHSGSGKAVKKGLSDIGISHLAFTVTGIDKEHKRLSDIGVKFVSKPELSPDGYAKVAFCSDPDGVFIELVEVMEAK